MLPSLFPHCISSSFSLFLSDTCTQTQAYAGSVSVASLGCGRPYFQELETVSSLEKKKTMDADIVRGIMFSGCNSSVCPSICPSIPFFMNVITP